MALHGIGLRAVGLEANGDVIVAHSPRVEPVISPAVSSSLPALDERTSGMQDSQSIVESNPAIFLNPLSKETTRNLWSTAMAAI